MVSEFIPGNTITVVDPDNQTIVVTAPLTINIDGGLGKPHMVQNNISFNLGLENGKIKRWDGQWNNQNAEMNAALKEVTEALQANA